MYDCILNIYFMAMAVHRTSEFLCTMVVNLTFRTASGVVGSVLRLFSRKELLRGRSRFVGGVWIEVKLPCRMSSS